MHVHLIRVKPEHGNSNKGENECGGPYLYKFMKHCLMNDCIVYNYLA